MRKRHTKKSIIAVVAIALAVAEILGALGVTSKSETAFARDVISFDRIGASEKLNFHMSTDGVLSWDEVSGATGYALRTHYWPGDFSDITVELTTNSYDIISRYDSLKRDTATYRIEVAPQGVVGYTDYIMYYYESPYEKLSMPMDLRWDGAVARWDSVDNATNGYQVRLIDTDGSGVTNQHTDNTYYDFSGLVQTGYIFEVTAESTSTMRRSNANDSKQYGEYTLAFEKTGVNEKLNFQMSNGGNLSWDEVPGATGYTLEIYYWPGDFADRTFNLTVNEHFLIHDFNNRKLDTGEYRIVVRPQGVSGYDDYIMYYYVSPYSKLATPTNIRWEDKVARWDEVEDAYEGYQVYLYNANGETVTPCITHETYCDFTSESPDDGWIFTVKAKSTALSRSSDAYASQAYVKPVHQISTGVYNATLGVAYSGGRISIQTNLGECVLSYSGCYTEATDETNVTLNAIPDDGYRFVAWKIGNGETGNVFSTEPNHQFTITSGMPLYAVFRDVSETHQVSFDTRGGNDITTQTIPYGLPAEEPEKPIRDGYVFAGWYSDSELTEEFDFDTVIESDMNLHAKWLISIPTANLIIDEPEIGGHPDFTPIVDGEHYRVEFEDWVLVDSDLYPILTTDSVFEEGEYYEMSVDLYTDEGYGFPDDAVYTVNGHEAYRAGGSGATYIFLRYRLLMEPEVVPHTLHFEANGGSGEMADITGLTGIVDIPNNSFTAPEHKQFAGWSENPEGEIITYIDMTTSDKTVYAIWENTEAIVEHYLTSANVLIDNPIIGGHPDFTPVVDGEHYRVEFVDWVLYDSELDYPVLDADATFEEGKRYELSIRLYSDDGYGFTEDADYTVNGRAAHRAGGSGATYAFVRYNFQMKADNLQVNDKTEGLATITELEDGLKIRSEKTCTVIISYDDGDHYEKIPAVAAGEDNTYQFEFETIGETSALVVLKGDINMNGSLNARDSAKIDYYLLSDDNPNHSDLTDLEKLIVDVNNSGTVTARDASLLDYAILSSSNANHRDLEW